MRNKYYQREKSTSWKRTVCHGGVEQAGGRMRVSEYWTLKDKRWSAWKWNMVGMGGRAGSVLSMKFQGQKEPR